MKEIALLGTTGRVHADVMGALLARGLAVDTMVDFPEKVMIEDTRLVVQHLPVNDHAKVVAALQGYDTAVLAYSDNLEDPYTNDYTLKTFASTVTAAVQAGVKRVVVVGSPESEAFFVSELRRLDGIDWVFISTENDYPGRTAEQVADPTFHSAVYAEA